MKIDAELFKGKMEIIRELGSGVQAKTYEVKAEGKNLAFKKIPLTSNDLIEDEIPELVILSKFGHPNVLEKNKIWFGEDFIGIYLELAETTLLNYLSSGQEINKDKIIKEIVIGLEWLHSNCVIHGDFHINNVFMVNGQPKIGDFGMSKISAKKTIAWGPISNISPPEVLLSRIAGLDYKIGMEVDVWSLGCMIYHINNEKPLSVAESDDLVLAELKDAADIINQNKLLKKILVWDLNCRPSTKKILKFLDPTFNPAKQTKEQKNKTINPFTQEYLKFLLKMVGYSDDIIIKVTNLCAQVDTDTLLIEASLHIVLSIYDVAQDLPNYNLLFNTEYKIEEFNGAIKKVLEKVNFIV